LPGQDRALSKVEVKSKATAHHVLAGRRGGQVERKGLAELDTVICSHPRSRGTRDGEVANLQAAVPPSESRASRRLIPISIRPAVICLAQNLFSRRLLHTTIGRRHRAMRWPRIASNCLMPPCRRPARKLSKPARVAAAKAALDRLKKPSDTHDPAPFSASSSPGPRRWRRGSSILNMGSAAP